MRFILSLVFILSFYSALFSQEKFLEVSITPRLFSGDKVKNTTLIVNTLEGAVFEIQAKKKKTTFFLPAGEKYTISIEKDGFHPTFYDIDLRDAPREKKKKNRQQLELIPYLHKQDSERPIPVAHYRFDEKRGKVVKD